MAKTSSALIIKVKIHGICLVFQIPETNERNGPPFAIQNILWWLTAHSARPNGSYLFCGVFWRKREGRLFCKTDQYVITQHKCPKFGVIIRHDGTHLTGEMNQQFLRCQLCLKSTSPAFLPRQIVSPSASMTASSLSHSGILSVNVKSSGSAKFIFSS